MASLILSPAAKQDLDEAADYIAHRLQNPSAAAKFVKRIEKEIRELCRFPRIGTPLELRTGDMLYRYIVCGNYLIFYHISDDTAYIDRILYGRRDYLSLLFGDLLEADSGSAGDS